MQTITYKLDITPGSVPLTIHISQYDVGLRQYIFQPYTSVGEFTYVSGATVTLEATKPDGYAVIHNCTYNQDGSITYTVQEQLAAKAGSVWSKVVIRNGNDVLGTGAVVWMVDNAGVKDNAIISDSDIPAIQAAASSASLAEAAATQAAGYVDQAVILGGTPLVAATVSAMTNHDRVYVYTGSETGYTAGNWYYWNGSAWTSGGIYNSSAVQTDPTLSVSGMAADAAATGGLKSEITSIEKFANDIGSIGYDLTKTGYVRKTTSGGVSPGGIMSGGLHTDFIPVQNAKTVTTTTYGNSGVAVIAFYNSSKTYISGTAGSGNTLKSYSSSIPSNAVYVVFSCFASGSTEADWRRDFVCAVSSGKTVKSYFERINKTNVSTLGFSDIFNAKTNTYYGFYTNKTNANAITATEMANLPSYDFSYCSVIKYAPGDTNQYAMYIALCCNSSTHSAGECPTLFIAYGLDTSHMSAWQRVKNEYGMGKKVSIIGDSISSYSGYVPDGYSVYYPESDVTHVDSMWWSNALYRMGMTLLINASYSSSSVAGDDTDGAAVASSDARVNALANGTTLPDVIICFIGTNDFARDYAIGTWTNKQEVPTASNVTDFKPAYAKMVDKIQTAYPLAKVYCCTLLARTKGTDGTVPVVNGNGNTVDDFNEAIRDVARQLNCQIIELSNCGINQHNLSSYLINETNSFIHPNAAGQKVIADAVFNALT